MNATSSSISTVRSSQSTTVATTIEPETSVITAHVRATVMAAAFPRSVLQHSPRVKRERLADETEAYARPLGGRERGRLDAQLVHLRAIRAEEPPRLAVTARGDERRHEPEVGRLVVGVAFEDAEELAGRIVRIAARRCVVRRAPEPSGRTPPAPPRAAGSPSPRTRSPRGSSRRRAPPWARSFSVDLRAPPLTPERQARGGAVEELLDVELEVGELQPDGALLSGHEVLAVKALLRIEDRANSGECDREAVAELSGSSVQARAPPSGSLSASAGRAWRSGS